MTSDVVLCYCLASYLSLFYYVYSHVTCCYIGLHGHHHKRNGHDNSKNRNYYNVHYHSKHMYRIIRIIIRTPSVCLIPLVLGTHNVQQPWNWVPMFPCPVQAEAEPHLTEEEIGALPCVSGLQKVWFWIDGVDGKPKSVGFVFFFYTIVHQFLFAGWK